MRGPVLWWRCIEQGWGWRQRECGDKGADWRAEPTHHTPVSRPSLSNHTHHHSSATTAPPPTLPFRVGHGFDLHRLEEGPYKLILGGVDIPHDRGCVAHSDGDALLHTVTDALLGALGEPDIGQLFPDNDPKWKGQTSDVFVREAVRLMRARGYTLGNLDVTVILQRPKLSPHKDAIKTNLCALLDAHPSVVNVKAKTHEKVDSMGEGRSVACHAVVLLVKA